MLPHVTDQLERVRFSWPEPVVIEFLEEQYAQRVPAAERGSMARLHARVLRDSVQDLRHSADASRETLLGAAARIGMSASEIRVIDRLVLAELVTIVAQRFRNSPRAKSVVAAQLAEKIDPPAEVSAEKRYVLFRRSVPAGAAA